MEKKLVEREVIKLAERGERVGTEERKRKRKETEKRWEMGKKRKVRRQSHAR